MRAHISVASTRTAAGARPKTAPTDRQVRYVDALRAAGYSVKQVVADRRISRPSAYRALVIAAAESGDDPERPAPARLSHQPHA
jgi:hypothetical protein